jgi:hypothetical protein
MMEAFRGGASMLELTGIGEVLRRKGCTADDAQGDAV